jgi:hypothetical protein
MNNDIITPTELQQIRGRDRRMAALKGRYPDLVLGPMDGDMAHGDRGMLLSYVAALEKKPHAVDISRWCEKNLHMLEVLSPLDIVTAWEEFRVRSHSSGGAEHEA